MNNGFYQIIPKKNKISFAGVPESIYKAIHSFRKKLESGIFM